MNQLFKIIKHYKNMTDIKSYSTINVANIFVLFKSSFISIKELVNKGKTNATTADTIIFKFSDILKLLV